MTEIHSLTHSSKAGWVLTAWSVLPGTSGQQGILVLLVMSFCFNRIRAEVFATLLLM